jgi:FkbM family methyltransferase
MMPINDRSAPAPAAKPPLVAEVLGHRMLLHEAGRDRYISTSLSAAGVMEPLETELIASLVRPGDTVLDLGANIGYYTLLAARVVGPSGCVYAFEPDPVNFALLRQNVAANGYRNVVLCPLAVSDRCGDAQLFLSTTNAGDHQLFASAEGRQSVAAKVVTLDSYFEKYPGRIDLIKMDIQGCECAALAGMRGLLARQSRLALLTEFWPRGLRLAGTSAQAYLDLLQDFGFRLWQIREDVMAVQRVNSAFLLRTYPAESDNFTNLLAIKTSVGLPFA